MAIPTRIDVSPFSASISLNTMFTGGMVNYIIETPNSVNYLFYIDENSNPAFKKSLDGGITWGTSTSLKACSATQISVWYDRWSGINADLIHAAYTDSTSDDVFYRNIDTTNADALSTEYTIFAGASTATGGALSISRMRGGNLICVGCIDAGVELYSKKSTNIGANWSNIAAGYEANADLCIVMPGWGADNQDAMMFYYDRSATEISVKYYDDSADSWSETSIATSISLPDHSSATLGHMSATVDLTNSQNLIVFWTAVDTANADLRCFKVTQSAQTETTSNVVLNSADDQGFCGISISQTNIWYVFYCGKSDGSEVVPSNLNIYYKTSVDSGANWSAEIKLSNIPTSCYCLFTKPIHYKSVGFIRLYTNVQMGIYYYNAPLSIPHANYILGI